MNLLQELDPEWADCDEAYGGVFDPPLALKPATAFVVPTLNPGPGMTTSEPMAQPTQASAPPPPTVQPTSIPPKASTQSESSGPVATQDGDPSDPAPTKAAPDAPLDAQQSDSGQGQDSQPPGNNAPQASPSVGDNSSPNNGIAAIISAIHSAGSSQSLIPNAPDDHALPENPNSSDSPALPNDPAPPNHSASPNEAASPNDTVSPDVSASSNDPVSSKDLASSNDLALSNNPAPAGDSIPPSDSSSSAGPGLSSEHHSSVDQGSSANQEVPADLDSSADQSSASDQDDAAGPESAGDPAHLPDESQPGREVPPSSSPNDPQELNALSVLESALADTSSDLKDFNSQMQASINVHAIERSQNEVIIGSQTFTQVFAPSGSIVFASSQTTAILAAGDGPLEIDGHTIHAEASSNLAIASGSFSTTISLATPSQGAMSEMFTTGGDGLPTPVVDSFVYTNAHTTLTTDRTPDGSVLSSLGLLPVKTIMYSGEDKGGSLATTFTSSRNQGSKATSASGVSSDSTDSSTTKNNDGLTNSDGSSQTTGLQRPTESLTGSASDDTNNSSGVILHGPILHVWGFLVVILGLAMY